MLLANGIISFFMTEKYPTKGFPVGSAVKTPPAKAGDMGLIPGLGRSPGEGNVNPLSILGWRIPWTEKPGMLQFMGLQRV